MTAIAETVIWHDVECGRYRADLPLWRTLAAAAGGPILEIGAGTGRVTLDLARRGHEVTAVEIDCELAGELVTRAAGLAVDVLCADITQKPSVGRHALIIAPMQVIQVLGGERERLAMFRHARDCLEPGAGLVVAFVDTVAEIAFGRSDIRQEDSLVLEESRYTSRAVSVQFSRRAIQIVRERRTRDPTGSERRSRSHQSLAVLSQAQVIEEAARARLELARVHEVPGTGQDLGCVALAFRHASGSTPR